MLHFLFCCFFQVLCELTLLLQKKRQYLIVFQHYWQLDKEKRITKCVKAALCILSVIQLAPELIPGFWPIFTDIQNEVFSSNLNISAKYEPN